MCVQRKTRAVYSSISVYRTSTGDLTLSAEFHSSSLQVWPSHDRRVSVTWLWVLCRWHVRKPGGQIPAKGAPQRNALAVYEHTQSVLWPHEGMLLMLMHWHKSILDRIDWLKLCSVGTGHRWFGCWVPPVPQDMRSLPPKRYIQYSGTSKQGKLWGQSFCSL